MSGSWQAERESRQTRRHPRDDPRTEVGEDVRVGVGVRVGPMEFQLNRSRRRLCLTQPQFNQSVQFV